MPVSIHCWGFTPDIRQLSQFDSISHSTCERILVPFRRQLNLSQSISDFLEV